MLEVKNLSKSFSSLCVIDNVSCKFKEGEIIALLGENGSGKTTMLKCLANIINIDNGEINYNNNQFIFINDKPNIFGDLNIKENLRCILSIYNQKINLNKYDKFITILGLENMQSVPLKYFSAGNLQRNKLLIALNLDWKYLFIDEPFSNLDDKGVSVFQTIFLNLKTQNKTILFSTHNFSSISDICDKSMSIKDGKIYYDD
ncbi:MAG: ABC transporter ATP-binding protein [Candidatus Neomarinimicrobiota bacterium]|jgi:ABC-type multidrug transport system ATPase subunit|uniref:ABC transporter domain-containing protein n=1 Tax=marine metagenome TaxID=408172 RepID=A0A381QK82_9ZZZZ|nr:ABC transporter ATP-binding protein [Candidatus Neomarinimicrobiota bacterium]|tara:strand:- start:463 stop:1068 length:606 start_codon:yes stop_codon:yes gene_type:complete